MAQRCKICIHQDRVAIEQLIIDNVTSRIIASKWGTFSYGTVTRHKKHMAPILSIARNERTTDEVVTAVVEATLTRTEQFHARFTELRNKVDELLATAEADGNISAQVTIIREARGLLDLESKVVLQILGMGNDEDNDVHVQYEIMGDSPAVDHG